MDKKKLIGAILCGTIFILYFGGIFSLFLFGSIFSQDLPLAIVILLLLILSTPLIGIITALYFRIKEIKNGEEEEAKKY